MKKLSLYIFLVLFFHTHAFSEVYKCSSWFSSHEVEINYNSGTLNGINYPSHDQKVNSAGHNWHYIKKISRSGDEINFLEVIQNDNGLVSKINYFIINTKDLKYKEGEEHRTQLVIVNFFKDVFNIGSGYDGKCKPIK